MDQLDPIDKALLDDFQRDFPLSPRPYAVVAERLGIEEAETLARLRRLQDQGLIARIGLAVRPNTVGASTLAAMAVPPERLEEVAAVVGGQPGVNHNYGREHRLNLWFVVAGPDRAFVDRTLAAVGAATGLAVRDFPLLAGYHIDLGFPLWTH